MVWLVRNFKLKVTQNSKELYSLGGLAYLGNDDDDNDGGNGDGDGGEDSKVNHRYQPRKRHF